MAMDKEKLMTEIIDNKIIYVPSSNIVPKEGLVYNSTFRLYSYLPDPLTGPIKFPPSVATPIASMYV